MQFIFAAKRRKINEVHLKTAVIVDRLLVNTGIEERVEMWSYSKWEH